MTRITTEQMADASPSAFDSFNDDVKTAVQVLKAEAAERHGSMDGELLDAAAEYLKHEVKN